VKKVASIPQIRRGGSETISVEEMNELITTLNEILQSLTTPLVGEGETAQVITPDAAGFKGVHTLGAGSLFLLSSVTALTLGGFAGGFDGRVATIRNNGAQTITLRHEFTGIEEENRISLRTGTTLTITAGSQLALIYDGKSQRWVPLAVGP